MSDYGTGCAGVIAALIGFDKRATEGASWWGGVSLVAYDVYLLSLGLYVTELKARFGEAGFHGKGDRGPKHSDSVSRLVRGLWEAMREVSPALFDDKHFHQAWSRGFGAKVRCARSAIDIEGVKVWFSRGSSPNDFGKGEWDGWEIDQELINS